MSWDSVWRSLKEAVLKWMNFAKTWRNFSADQHSWAFLSQSTYVDSKAAVWKARLIRAHYGLLVHVDKKGAEEIYGKTSSLN